MLNFLKRLTSAKPYTQATVRVMEGGGRLGEKRPAFDQNKGVNAFNSWVYAAAMINAQACAATPLRLYVRRDRRRTKLWDTRAVDMQRRRYLLGDEQGGLHSSPRTIRKLMELGHDFEEVTEEHPLISLLSSVNPRTNGFDLTVNRILMGELTGNAYHAVVFNEDIGVPGQLWNMPSQFTFIIPDRDKFVKGFAYAAPGNDPVEFDTKEVIHFRRPNPRDVFYGMGKVEAAWGTIGVNDAMHEMDLATFANHARPDYAVVVKGPSKQNDLDRFEDYVNERLQGTRKAGKFLTMTGDVQLTPLNFPPKDLQGREEVVEEIAAVFGVPVSLLKANDPNLASARSGYAQWREGTILPLLRMDEDELNQSLVPMFGLEGEAVLAYDNPVPKDEVFELQKRQAAVQGGWMTLNEVRIEEGNEPYQIPEADAPLIGGMPMMPQEEAPPEEEAGPPQAEATAEGAPSEGLNGAQISSMVEMLDGVASGTMLPQAAIEIAVATGIPRERAAQMVQQQVDAKPQALVEAQIEEEVAAEVVKRFLGTKSDNCGTGAGGFQPGNDCAAGDGGGSSETGARNSKEYSKRITRAVERRRSEQSPEDKQAEKDAAEAVTETVVRELDDLETIHTGKLDWAVTQVARAHDLDQLDKALADRGVLSPQAIAEMYGTGLEGFVQMTKDIGIRLPSEIPDVLSVDQMSAPQQKAAARLLAGARIAHERFLPEYAVNHGVMFHSGSELKSDLGDSAAFAIRGRSGRVISMNVDLPHTFDNASRGLYVAHDAASLYVHEVAHVLHSQRVKGLADTDRPRFKRIQTATERFAFDKDRLGLIRRRVSNYATKNPFEFVAETFTMKQTTPKKFEALPAELRDLYEELGGP